MSTIQKQIRDAVMVRLQTIPGVTTFFRSPRRVIGEQELPALCLYSHNDKPLSDDDDHQQAHQRVYTLRVEIRAQGRPEEDATDDLCIAVRRALLQDDSLGQLVNRITWGDQQWDGSEDENPLAGTALDFNVFYLWRPE
jgi:hypothetical protein